MSGISTSANATTLNVSRAPVCAAGAAPEARNDSQRGQVVDGRQRYSRAGYSRDPQ